LAVVGVALMAAACVAPTQKMNDADRAQAKTARINDKVKKAPQVFVLAPSGANVAGLFGAVGGVVMATATMDAPTAFEAFLQKNSISIEKIVREEVESALRASGRLAIVAQTEAAAPLLNIAVPEYGFGVPHLFSSNVVPVLGMRCELVDNAGKVLWSAGDRMGPSIASPVESTSWDAMHADPKLIEEKWRKAAALLAKRIMQEL